MKRLSLLVILALLCSSAFAKDKKQKQFSDIVIKVVKESNGKPVRSAAVVLHSVNDDGKQEQGGQNLKTDMDGQTVYQGLPYGKIRIQVIATGLQTYGEDFDINQPQQTFVIKMKPPQSQYTIYGDNPSQNKDPRQDTQPKK
jgi:hypothetical protein